MVYEEAVRLLDFSASCCDRSPSETEPTLRLSAVRPCLAEPTSFSFKFRCFSFLAVAVQR